MKFYCKNPTRQQALDEVTMYFRKFCWLPTRTEENTWVWLEPAMFYKQAKFSDKGDKSGNLIPKWVLLRIQECAW